MTASTSIDTSRTIDTIDQHFSLVAAEIAALDVGQTKPLGDSAAAQVLALAEAALEAGLVDAHQTARSMVSFLGSMRAKCLDRQDTLQLKLLLDNLRRELYPPSSSDVAPIELITGIARSTATSNKRVALFIESRAVSAMLQETLRRAGFSASPLTSMQALTECTEHTHPAAIVADLSLCQRDSYTHSAILALRDQFSPPPHLFCLAGGDDFSARLQAVRLGATRFLKKPVDADRLIAILRGVTAQIRMAPFRILFIDDDRSMTTIYAATMKQAGCEVHTINDPLAAPALVKEFSPDVIVTDLYMPGCNGLELAAVLRQDEVLADTPILFLSSESNIHRQMAALDLGADDFLTKPVNVEVLQAAVLARAKRARMLKRSRRELEQVTEHLKRIELAIDRHSIVSIGDLQGTILYANQRFCDVSGYNVSELLGANHRLIKSGVHPPEYYRSMWLTISTGRTWRGEVCNRRKDGSHYWVESTITPQLDDHGLPVRYISVRTDITPLKVLQEQLVIVNGEAEAASQAKTVFLAHMSHELKTPLNSILGFSQVMQADKTQPPSADQKEMLGAIERAGHHLLELISDLVDLAKIETGHLGLSMGNVALAPLIRECLALIKPLAQKRAIALTFDGQHDAVRVRADRMRVKQVMLNLLSNAVKYNRDKGSVTVSIRRHDGHWLVAVRDTGSGIAAPDQAALFLPFSRLRNTAQQVEGTGIGLSLSKSLIERMDGKIGVISHLGQGSEFWFDLPAADVDVIVNAEVGL